MLRKCLFYVGPCLFFLIAGVAIGIVISPNYMKVYVDPLGKLNLGAQNGDILGWEGLNPDWSESALTISFRGSSTSVPCDSNLLKNGLCLVKYPNPSGTYLYDCFDAKTNDPRCPDPNVGPSSVGGGGGLHKQGAGGLKLASRHLFAGFKIWALGLASDSQINLESGGGKLGATSAASAVEGYVDCDGGNPNATQVSPSVITINAGGSILWEGPNGPSGFTLLRILDNKGNPANICQNANWQTNRLCNVNQGITGTYSYTTKDARCSVSPTESIQVQ